MAKDESAGGGRRAPTPPGTRGIPWTDVLLASVASVSWALVVMGGTAALGLHLLGADSAGALGPMTAAVVLLGAGGRVVPSGDAPAFGLDGAEAHTALDVTPPGVGLAGALALAFFFLRSLRGAGASVSCAELCARTGSVAALFVTVLGGLTQAGHDVVTIDGSSLDNGRLPGGGLLGDPGGLGAAGRRAAPLARAPGPGGHPATADVPGPYTPSRPYRPPHDDTNPYLRPSEGIHSAPTVVGFGPDGPPVPPPPGPGPAPPEDLDRRRTED